jgi:hypothetical protein
MKKLLVVIAVYLTVLVIYSNNAKADDFSDAMMDAKKDLSTALNTLEKSDMLKVRGQFERILQLKQDEWLVNYYVALCDYFLGISEMSGGSNLGEEAKKNLQKYTESGLELVNGVIQKKSDFADAYILKKFLNFARWSYEQDKMNDIIAVDQQTEPKAKQYGEKNPRYYLVNGISAYWTPDAFGGGADRALELLSKANDLYSSSKPENELYPEWGYDWAIGYEVLSYIKRDDDGDKDMARKLLDEGILKNPESGFLKNYVKVEVEKSEKQN